MIDDEYVDDESDIDDDEHGPDLHACPNGCDELPRLDSWSQIGR